jgi:hypothetical protein
MLRALRCTLAPGFGIPGELLIATLRVFFGNLVCTSQAFAFATTLFSRYSRLGLGAEGQGEDREDEQDSFQSDTRTRDRFTCNFWRTQPLSFQSLSLAKTGPLAYGI